MADSRISSFDRRHVDNHLRWRKDVESELFGSAPRIDEIQVRCRTIADILAAAAWERADFLVVDAEGHDAVIVENVLNDGLDFSIIYFEYGNLRENQLRDLSAKLVAAKYALLRTSKDMLAVKTSALD